MQCCEAYKPVCKVSVYCIVVYALRSVYEGPEVHISSPSCSLRRKLSTNRPAPSPALVLAVSPISSICYCTCLPRRRLEVHCVMFIVGKCTALCPPPPSLCEVYYVQARASLPNQARALWRQAEPRLPFAPSFKSAAFFQSPPPHLHLHPFPPFSISSTLYYF